MGKESIFADITFQAIDTTREQLVRLYDSNEEGAERIIPGFLALREATLEELRRIFTREEFFGIIASQNGVLLDPAFQASREAFKAGLEDFEKLEHGISHAGATLKHLLEKVDKLTAAQVYFLQDEVEIYWRNSSKSDLDLFITSFCPGTEDVLKEAAGN